MNNVTGFEIVFGRHGRTVGYKDAAGEFTFVFDSDPNWAAQKETKEKLLLERSPLKNMKLWKCQTQADREHITLMLERIKQYLLSHNFEVEIV